MRGSGFVAFALLAIAVAGAGCAEISTAITDPLGRQDALSAAQKQYTEAIRWGRFERARAFVEASRRAAFEQLEPRFESIRITDFEIGEIEWEEPETAAVTVTYRGYALAQQIEKPFRERQQWTRDEGLSGQWRVRTDLPEQLSAFLGAAP